MVVAVVVLSIVLGAHRRHDASLDVFDEVAHYDYVAAVHEHHVPAWGDRFLQETLRLADCVGGPAGPTTTNCTMKHREPTAFPAAGYSYEAQQPPLGYVPYILTARPHASPQRAIATARRGGAMWTADAALLLLALAAVEGLSLLGFAVLLTACILSPVHIHAAATVNNDAAGVATGALALLTASVARRTGRPLLFVGAAVGFLIAMVKGLFVVAPLVLVLAAVLMERPWSSGRTGWRRLVRNNQCSVAMLATGGVTYLAWAELQNLRARVSPSIVLHALLGFSHTKYLQLGTIITGLKTQTSLLASYYPAAPMHDLWNLAFFAVVIATVLFEPRNRAATENRALAIASLLGLLALAIAWPLLTYVQGHYNFFANARYGLPLLPFLALVVIRSLPRSGLVILGLVLPTAAACWQLSVGKF